MSKNLGTPQDFKGNNIGFQRNLSKIGLDEMQNRMIDFLNEEVQLYSTGFFLINQNYQFLKGNCTDITGYPYSGKTLFLMEILFNLSVEHGMKHLLHLPDSGKPEEVIATLIQKKTGKTFDKRYPNLIEEAEIMREINWIHEHFQILQYQKRPTPFEFWDYAATLDVQTASIDSWNYMRHEGEGTKYLAEVLSYRNELAEKSNKHFFTIIHPRNPTANDYNANGGLKAPDVFNLMGGSEWNNNGKNIIVVHKEDKEGLEFDIYFRKIKPRIVGKTGMISLNYDISRQKFYEIDHKGNRIFAFGEVVENMTGQVEKKETIDYFGGFPEPNVDFNENEAPF